MTTGTRTVQINRLLMIAAIVCITLPALGLKFGYFHTGPGMEALLFGIGLLGAAFMLSWAAEVVQMDISQGFALAILALIAVLPEYAVDMVFAWKAGKDPAGYAHLALANMTGANRLLIGLGWPLVLFLFFLRARKLSLLLSPVHATELFFLACATVYAFIVPITGRLSLLDAVVFIILFAAYMVRTARAEAEEPDLIGPAALVGSQRPAIRRFWTIILFAYSGAIIFISAEPFAHSLVMFGKQSGVDEFLLVQWIAPMASEAPEFMIACIWAIRGQAETAMSALISSKVNQWTLLVGTLPIVFSISAGHAAALPLDLRQDHEIWLTAGQSLFAAAILANLQISWYGALALLVLFVAQLVVPHIRMEVLGVYIVLALIVFTRDRKRIPGIIKTGLKFR